MAHEDKGLNTPSEEQKGPFLKVSSQHATDPASDVETLVRQEYARIDELNSAMDYMQKYMDSKKTLGDWHAVMDAAADIREILVEIKTIKRIINKVEKL